MKIHQFESWIAGVSGGLLVVCLGALLYAVAGLDMHLPGHVARVDPEQVAETPPFDQPGLRKTGEDAYEVVLIGRIWSFTPGEIRVPAGAEVTFVGTSPDVIHGMLIPGTRVNVMLIPGQVTRVTHRFEEPGEYLLLCHEYCGVGHHTMFGKVIVE